MSRSNEKVIAQNTLFLYFRMIITMFITLYTSRVILQKMGVDDYGIYQAVGGIVGFLSFINGALATGASRFITYAIGKNSSEELKKTFSTTLLVHLFIAIIVIIIAESIGIWFMKSYMVIPVERMTAAIWTFHFSVLAAVFVLLQVPFNAAIIAHEKMSIYAYLSIFDAVAKLFICYLLTIGGLDKLVTYAILLCILQLFLLLFYWMYCHNSFVEVRLNLLFDTVIFKSIMSFSVWSLFSNVAIALNNQGALILLNMFFSPAVVTARAISVQVNSAASQFVNNFRQAVNPQIVKKYASGDSDGSKSLLLESTKYSFFLMLMLSLPICLMAESVIKLWLGITPEYSVQFLQIVIIQSLFQVFDTSFYTALYTNGRIRENALISPLLLFVLFPVVYILFKIGYSPLVLAWGSLIVYIILATIVKPILLNKIVGYTFRDFVNVYKPCLLVTVVSVPIPIIFYQIFEYSPILKLILITMVSVLCISLAIYWIGFTKEIRASIINIIKNKFYVS